LKSKPFFAGLLLLLLPLCASAETVLEDPQAVVKDTTDRMLAEIKDRKQELNQSPGKIYPLVEEIVLPRFDFPRMAQLVLGKHWKRAKQEQKKAFVAEFRQLLVRTYATALLNYSGQEIEYLPVNRKPEDKRVVVETKVRDGGSPPLPIEYKLFKDGDKWMVYDVVIDNVSLVSNYRSSYSSKIRRYKLDGLIKRLQAHNESRDK
jgi:phospholipid transport system substrate-binding protein